MSHLRDSTNMQASLSSKSPIQEEQPLVVRVLRSEASMHILCHFNHGYSCVVFVPRKGGEERKVGLEQANAWARMWPSTSGGVPDLPANQCNPLIRVVLG